MIPALLRRCCAVIACLALAACGQSNPPPQIAAAATLRTALTEVAASFEAQTGETVTLSFGSSGNFHRQLLQDAPFQLFLSADETYALDLARAGKTVDDGQLYAVGRLALVVPRGSGLALDERLDGLRQALAEGRITRFAIANPDHAPYGQRAREALQHAGLWDALEPHLIYGENVSQAVQFAAEGGAQGGIVAYSLARDPALASRADHVLLPEDWHQPLRQRMVLMRQAGDTARRFYHYLNGPDARSILERHGFALPDAPDR